MSYSLVTHKIYSPSQQTETQVKVKVKKSHVTRVLGLRSLNCSLPVAGMLRGQSHCLNNYLTCALESGPGQQHAPWSANPQLESLDSVDCGNLACLNFSCIGNN